MSLARMALALALFQLVPLPAYAGCSDAANEGVNWRRCMLDLAGRGRDLRAFVANLEGWLIVSLAELGIKGERREGRVGIWVSDEKGREAKIGALGVRVRRWVTFHGVSLNVAPDLTHFDAIVPCGIREHGVTSITEQGLDISMREVDEVLIRHFERMFGRSPRDCDAPLSEMARQA